MPYYHDAHGNRVDYNEWVMGSYVTPDVEVTLLHRVYARSQKLGYITQGQWHTFRRLSEPEYHQLNTAVLSMHAEIIRVYGGDYVAANDSYPVPAGGTDLPDQSREHPLGGRQRKRTPTPPPDNNAV